MKKTLIIFAAMLCCFASFAQEKPNRDAEGKAVYGPYLTNKWYDNTFIGIAGGVNMVTDKDNGYTGKLTPTFEINGGKWITPSIGVRLGVNGTFGKEDIESAKANEDFNYLYVHGDYMWNISNAFSGYRERAWDFVPYLHAGYMKMFNVENPTGGSNNTNRVNVYDNEFAGGVGLLNIIRLGNRVSLTIDARDQIYSGRYHSVYNGGAMHNFSGMIGLLFKMGKVGWDRYSCDCPTIDDSPLKDAIAALEAANRKLKDENDELTKRLAEIPEPRVIPESTEHFKFFENKIIVYYEINKSVLLPSELEHLDTYMHAIIDNDKDHKFYLTGSADEGTGNYEINTRLSKARAQDVKDLLLSRYDIKPENIIIKGNIISNEHADGRLDRCTIIEL